MIKKIFGVRTIKTALATSLAIMIAYYLDLKTPILAGISVVVSMSSSVFESYQISFNRMLSTILGAIIACFFQAIGHTGFVEITIGIIIIINICNYFKWNKSIALAIIVFVIIMLYEPNAVLNITYWQYGINRIIDTFVGLAVGFTVNYLIFPPNRAKFLVNTYRKTIKEFDVALKGMLVSKNDINMTRLVDDINEINTELKSIKNDSKIKTIPNFKISKISKVNSQFFSCFGLITQLAEDRRIPRISKENMAKLNIYFGEELKIKEDNCELEYEMAFNYYLHDLVDMMMILRDFVDEFKGLAN